MTQAVKPIVWHGWSRRKGAIFGRFEGTRKALYIGLIPRRSQPALYSMEGSVIRILAYFKSQELAVEAMALLDELTGAQE